MADTLQNHRQSSSRLPPRRILFVCLGNSCRSQMAEGYARRYGKSRLEVSSAGLLPGESLSAATVEVMREEGIDLSGHYTKSLTREAVERADLVVALGGDPASRYPDLLEGKLIAWAIPDPFGRPLDYYRRVRDQIEKKVVDLLISLEGSEDKV